MGPVSAIASLMTTKLRPQMTATQRSAESASRPRRFSTRPSTMTPRIPPPDDRAAATSAGYNQSPSGRGPGRVVVDTA